MVSRHAGDSGAISERLVQGLSKVATVIRSQDRSASHHHGLSPTQAQLLIAVAGEDKRVSELAAVLGVGSATVSESIDAVEAKGLVARTRNPSDRRVVLVEATSEGKRVAAALTEWPDELAAAIDLLDPGERSALLTTIVKLIRRLQLADRIPIARVCVSCAHFEPFAHDEGPPHHCRFVDEPFGQESLRVDCADHAVAKDSSAEERWMTRVEIIS